MNTVRWARLVATAAAVGLTLALVIEHALSRWAAR
jgi:hypothetical protein